MRILGFSKAWPKLQQEQFTTFRMPRQDKDWQTGEQVQVYLWQRTKNRRYMGLATILNVERRRFYSGVETSGVDYSIASITAAEAIEDGFEDYPALLIWMAAAHGWKAITRQTVINKLTLTWTKRQVWLD